MAKRTAWITLRNIFTTLLPGLLISVNLFAQDTVTVDTLRPVTVTAERIDSVRTPVVTSAQSDSIKAPVVGTEVDTLTIRTDSISDAVNDYSVNDIGANRGIYILSDDQTLELRILGSIRALFNYSNRDLNNKQTVNPYDVPTGTGHSSPNFFAGLQQTRIGLEVTRKTKSLGDVFMRLETDFNNGLNTLRIRHAYGSVGRFLVGQTWSLLNNAGYLPLAVSHHGPAGAISIRTPQIRYTRRYQNKTSWSVAFEYSPPDIDVPDSLELKAQQVIPNLTARYTYSSDRLTLRLAGIASLLVGQSADGEIGYRGAYGASLALSLKAGAGTIFGSFTTGQAIEHYLNMFRRQGQDVAYDPTNGRFEAIYSTAAYLAYEHPLPLDLRASLAFGFASLSNRAFHVAETYDYGYNMLLNVFWAPVSGMTLGLEYGLGARTDISGQEGFASRFSVLAYYDF